MFKRVDKSLLFSMLALSIFSLIIVYSSSNAYAVLRVGTKGTHFFIRQLIFVSFSWFIGLFVLKFPTKYYKPFTKIIIIGVIALMFYLHLYGSLTNNVKSWIRIFGITIQPSELGKMAIILYLADRFNSKRFEKSINLQNMISIVILPGAIVLLTLLEPDLGTAVILFGLVAAIILSLPHENENLKIIKSMTKGIVYLGVFLMLFGGTVLTPFLTEEQQSRLTYKNPCSRYEHKTGYQVCNGFIAISNGGILGKGLGNSTQKYLYLPEAHTDFILPIVVEELGILGISVYLIVMISLLRSLISIARHSSNLQNSIIAFGTFMLFLLHLLINFLGVLAIIPLTGVPVPFLSYGGSFYLTIMILLFINQRIYMEDYTYRYNKMYRKGL